MAEGETPSYYTLIKNRGGNNMGCKYKKEIEREWEGKSLSDIKIKTMQLQADRNITNLLKNKRLYK